MIIWIVIYGNPTRQFYINADALPYLSSAFSKHGILIDPGQLQASVDGENTNITVQLDNRSGQCTALFTRPPVGARAEWIAIISEDPVVQFSGIIQSIELTSNQCSISVES